MAERSFERFKKEAIAAVGAKTWDWCSNGLDKIYRWGYIPGVPERFESDAEHVEELFDNNDHLVRHVPQVVPYVDLKIVHAMFVLHDLPEVIVGDLSHQHPDYENLKVKYKIRERLAMKGMIRLFSSVNPEGMRSLSDQGIDPVALLDRFERHEDGDTEALLAKYHDYEQAIIKARQHGLLKRLNHGTNLKTVHLAERFTQAIPDLSVQQQLREYFRDRLDGVAGNSI